MSENIQKATFGMGCFWHSEEVIRSVDGVTDTTVGYMGGSKKSPSYEQVCTDKTGHVEVVQLEFEPKKVSYDELLTLFWKQHDPTTPNQQGADIGSQYRSVIFYHSDMQKAAAETSKERVGLSDMYHDPLVTTIEEAREFYMAEEYHQKYLAKKGLSTCPI